MRTICCPVCKGTGKLEDRSLLNKAKEIERKKNAAIKLREIGYSIREIQRMLGYKSPRSIHLFLK